MKKEKQPESVYEKAVRIRKERLEASKAHGFSSDILFAIGLLTMVTGLAMTALEPITGVSVVKVGMLSITGKKLVLSGAAFVIVGAIAQMRSGYLEAKAKGQIPN